MGTRLLRLVLALLLVLAVAAPTLADRETATFFADRGEKALKADDAAGAEEHFRRALEEDETYAPARFGLARALIAAELRKDGVVELKRSVTELAGDPAWKSELRAARQLLDEIDRAGAQLRGIVDAHADQLVAFAKKWLKKDEDAAVRALRSALALRPGHAKAAQLIESLGHSAKGPPRELVDGQGFDGWAEMGPPRWKVQNGVIVAEVKEGAYIARSEEMFEGDFDVRMEARVLETHDGPSYFALAPAFDGRDGHYSFGLLKGKFLFQEDVDPETEREFFSRLPPHDFEPTEWHVYELRFRKNRVIALVDGEELGADEERPDSRSGGFVGIKCQACKIAIRSVEVVQR